MDLVKCGEAIHIISVLSSFNFNKLWVIHTRISEIHDSNVSSDDFLLVSSLTSRDTYNCV